MPDICWNPFQVRYATGCVTYPGRRPWWRYCCWIVNIPRCAGSRLRCSRPRRIRPCGGRLSSNGRPLGNWARPIAWCWRIWPCRRCAGWGVMPLAGFPPGWRPWWRRTTWWTCSSMPCSGWCDGTSAVSWGWKNLPPCRLPGSRRMQIPLLPCCHAWRSGAIVTMPVPAQPTSGGRINCRWKPDGRP